MTRFHHRIKTFGLWRVTQLGLGAYLWHSPHDHCWLVDPTGTHKVPNAALPWMLPGVAGSAVGSGSAVKDQVTSAA